MAAVHPNRNAGYFSLSGSVGETLREAPMKFRRSRWKPGTVYGIPLADGSFGIGQSIDAMWESVIYIAVFSYHFDRLPVAPPHLEAEDILSLGAVLRPDLNNGSWATIGIAEPIVGKQDFPNEAFSTSGYVGAEFSSGGVFSEFLSACFGLTPGTPWLMKIAGRPT